MTLEGTWIRSRTVLALAIAFIVLYQLAGGAPTAQTAVTPPDLASQAEALLTTTPWTATLDDLRAEARNAEAPVVREVRAVEGRLTVCLEVAPDLLAVNGWLGVERVETAVRQALMSLDWQQLAVEAWDPESSTCLSLASFTPEVIKAPQERAVPEPWIQGVGEATVGTLSASAATGVGALAGKTVYVSAGHGWNWNGSSWRTQRPVYQGFIEDHNNAEVVDQYLLAYLENAGAEVIPLRERDWSRARYIADNDAGSPTYEETGTWANSSLTGYGNTTYRYATSVTGDATAQATWTVNVATPGRYAVYAWYVPGSNRVPDAHYTIHHAGGVAEVIHDQRVGPETWHYLGMYPFNAGPVRVVLDNRSGQGAGAAVIADALRIGSGGFDTLAGIPLLVSPGSGDRLPSSAPMKPWWETSVFYYSQWSGYPAGSYFNDVVSRPMFAKWYQRERTTDAVFISWHTNGHDGTARGTVSYIYNGRDCPRTEGSLELQAAVHNELVHDIRAGWDPAWQDRGTRQADLGEVRVLWDEEAAARMPGVLLEIAFHDNPEDANALKDPLFNQLAARAVYQGIVRYFEQRDGADLTLLPEPPTHLRMENLDAGTVRVAWQPPATDTAGLRGDAATAYHLYTSSDGFAWGTPVLVSGTSHVIGGLTPGQTVYARVTAVNAGGESLPSEVVGARVGEARLLIVQGFDRLDRFGLVREVDAVEGANLRILLDRINSQMYVVHHGQAVPADIAWDSASNEAVQAQHVHLGDYAVVDWILGEESSAVEGAFNAAERQLVTNYLDSGGSLLISGSELAWDLEGQGRDPTFLNEPLHTRYVADDAGTVFARPVTGGALHGLGDICFDAASAEQDHRYPVYDVDYPDVLAPGDGASSALTYVGGTGGTAAVQYVSGCQRLLVLGFPIEAVVPTHRSSLMATALGFLDACGPTGATVVLPAPGGYYTSLRTASGTATGTGLERVEVQLERVSDGLCWNGETWSKSTWLVATGTTTWSYQLQLPALAEGNYVFRARAIAEGTATSSHDVAFGIDTTPPLIPTVLTPSASVEFPGPFADLRWLRPTDSGSPLHYDVEINATVTPTTDTYLKAVLGPGSHNWRVRAVDAAGNEGRWSAWHSFVMNTKQIFLPLGMRN